MSSSPHLGGVPHANDVTRIVVDLAHRFDDITGIVVFSHDGLLRVFAPPLSLQEAERWAALLNQLVALARRADTVLDRGGVDSTLVRVSAQHAVLVQPVTEATDIGVLAQGAAPLAQIAHASAQAAARLRPLLPREVSRRIGAPLQAAVA